jgi:putative transposon-encoded protein
MGSTKIKEATELTVDGIEGFFEKTVTKFGSGAKIDCPKRYLGRDVFVVVRRAGSGRVVKKSEG